MEELKKYYPPTEVLPKSKLKLRQLVLQNLDPNFIKITSNLCINTPGSRIKMSECLEKD